MHLCGRRSMMDNIDEDSVSDDDDGPMLAMEEYKMYRSPHRRSSRRSTPTVMGDCETFIPHLMEEDSVDQFESIVETAGQYHTEIIEETGVIFERSLLIITTIIIGCITNLCSLPRRTTRSILQEFRDAVTLNPISEKFNYSGLAIGYFWSCVIMKVKCWGEIFASTHFGYMLLSYMFPNSILLVLLLYILLPYLVKLIHLKTPQSKLSNGDRRLLVLIFAFIIGAGTHFALLNWRQPALSPPPFFSPTVVALVVEFIGPMLSKRRRLFIIFPISTATVVCILYGIQNDIFDFNYFYLTILAVLLSSFNLQLLIARSDNEHGDPILGHITLPINSMYNQLITTLLLGEYYKGRNLNDVIPDSIEEDYSILAHK